MPSPFSIPALAPRWQNLGVPWVRSVRCGWRGFRDIPVVRAARVCERTDRGASYRAPRREASGDRPPARGHRERQDAAPPPPSRPPPSPPPPLALCSAFPRSRQSSPEPASAAPAAAARRRRAAPVLAWGWTRGDHGVGERLSQFCELFGFFDLESPPNPRRQCFTVGSG